MSADAAERPVKPSMPATIDTRKKISAHLRIVIGPLPKPASRAWRLFR
jgi:hypothetical protein